MKGVKGMKLGLLAIGAVAALVAGLIVAAQVSAVSGQLSIGSMTAAPNGTGTVEVHSNVPTPGLGAWTLDIAYDPTKVTVGTCTPTNGGVCNTHYSSTTIRIAGASASGLTGDTNLGTIAFTCGSALGSSSLTITPSVFADGTVGSPQPITVTPTNGAVTCAVAPTATVGVLAGTATSLPPTGYGSSTGGSDSSLGWIIAGLAGAGLAAIAGFGALRLGSRRS